LENNEKISEAELKNTLRIVYDSLEADGYVPAKQLTEYILSQDPAYITCLNNARGIMRNIDRDLLLSVLIENFMKN